MAVVAAGVVLGISGSWGRPTAETPVVSVPITATGGTFASWKVEDGFGAGWATENCKWWTGTHYYDTGVCNAFSITRVSSSDADTAIERARHCMALTGGESECVLNGEIGFTIPSAFLYDHEAAEMRMLIAPRILAHESDVKTIRMQDPRGGNSGGDIGVHPNQLFEFNTTVKVEYLKGGARTMVTEVLTGQEAFCIQALRRSIPPTCWEALD